MREAVCVDKLVNGGEDVLVAGDVVEGCWTVFFDPRMCQSSYLTQKKNEL